MALTKNKNYLSSVNFALVLNRIPNVEFFCQKVTLPEISIDGVVDHISPFSNMKRPGEKITYGTLEVSFRLDENLLNYSEIFNWMNSIARSSDFGDSVNDPYSDGTVIINNSHNNPIKSFTFHDMYPISLSNLNFDSTLSEETYLTADVSFNFTKYEISDI